MDAVDLKILKILQADGRTSHSEIAKTVGLSAPSVGERIRKLETNGILIGYRALIDPQRVKRPITAFVNVKLKSAQHAKGFEKEIVKLPEILECHLITGEIDYQLKMRAQSLERLEEVLQKNLRSIEGVATTNTSICLRIVKEDSQLQLSLEDLEN